MLKFDFRKTENETINEKYHDFLDRLYFSDSIPDQEAINLLNLSGFSKLISLCGGKILNINSTVDQMSLFASFPRKSFDSRINLTRRIGKEFDISSTAAEKNIHQCMEDRKFIFKELGRVFDGTERFFKNTSNAVRLVNDYFESMSFGKCLYTVEEFAEANFGKKWQEDKRICAYVKVLEATCGTSNFKGNEEVINWNYSAIFDSLTEVMDFDKSFQARTKAETKYVENKVDAISSVQESIVDSANALSDVNIETSSKDVENNIKTMLEVSKDEIIETPFINDPIDVPTSND